MKLANITLVFAAVLAFGLIACGNDENPTISSTKTTLTASLNGASEKPSSTSSAATGTFTGVVDETTRVLSYTVTYTGPFTSSLTAGHLHRVTNTTALTGGVEIPFTSLVSPITGTFQLANQNRVDSLKNGFYYANLHTAQYPGGEIRGDIKKK